MKRRKTNPNLKIYGSTNELMYQGAVPVPFIDLVAVSKTSRNFYADGKKC